MFRIYCPKCGAFSQNKDPVFALHLWDHPEDFFNRAFWRGVNVAMNARPKRAGFFTWLLGEIP